MNLYVFSILLLSISSYAMEDTAKTKTQKTPDEFTEGTINPFKERSCGLVFSNAYKAVLNLITDASMSKISTRNWDLLEAIAAVKSNSEQVNGMTYLCAHIALLDRERLTAAVRDFCSEKPGFYFLTSDKSLNDTPIFVAGISPSIKTINLKKIAEKLKTEFANNNPHFSVSIFSDSEGHFMRGTLPPQATYNREQMTIKLKQWLKEMA